MNWMDKILREVVGECWTGLVTCDPVDGHYHVLAMDSSDVTSYSLYHVYVTASRQEALEAAEAVSLLSKHDWEAAQWQLPCWLQPVKWKVLGRIHERERWIDFRAPPGCSDKDVIACAQGHYLSMEVPDGSTLYLDTIRRVTG